MGYVVAVVGQKGGSGKSTLALALAGDLHARGQRVLLVDADPQGTCSTFAAVAAELGHDAPTVAALGPGLHRPEGLPTLARGFDVAVLDTPPHSGQLQRAALAVADVALVPVGPSAVEAWALAASVELVAEAQALRPELVARLVVTRRDTRTVLGREVRRALESAGVPLLRSTLGHRVSYAEAPAAGLAVTRYAPTSPAAAEVRALVDELLELLPRRPGVAPKSPRRKRAR